MINKDGKAVAPTAEAFQAAAANADWKSQPGFGVILANQPGATVLADDRRDLDPDPQEAGRIRRPSAEALKFFAWAYDKGDKMAEELDYVPMPANVVDATSRRPGRPRSRTRAASRSTR